jgi:signal transduction histidine kinase
LVSHEFRTPLSIILGSAQLLAQGITHGDNQKQQKNLERIQYSARLMTQLITDILTITRAETGKLEFNPSWLEVDSFCLNLITNLQFDKKQQSKIQFFSEGQCVYAWLDEKLLHSMLSNLLANAIKYSPNMNLVQLKVINEPNSIIFEVTDQGIGIPLESQSSLYEPFYRADNVGIISGTGLGLTVVKNCVELHHGQIEVVSNLGMGTTFSIQIPQQSSRQRFNN